MRRRVRLLSACLVLATASATVVTAVVSRAWASSQRPAQSVVSVPVPAAGRLVNTSHPTHVVGHGTAASCSSAAVVAAVKLGGVITFSCGPNPVTIRMNVTAKVKNTSPRVVLDGGGLVTLSGEGRRRILYMDTCDPKQVWTTPHCQDQATPSLVVQNLNFTDGNSTGEDFDGGGGGAIFDRGGRLRIVDSNFTDNRCERDGPDLGGAAVRALSQYNNLPVYLVGSSFTGNSCSNGAALSSIGVSWTVLNSRFVDNRATGRGANPAQSGTPGGGSGGAIYNDGDQMTLTVGGCVFTGNHANEGGGAIFFVSDNRTGTMVIRHSELNDNPNKGFQTPGLAGIFFLTSHKPTISDSVLR
jgi:predicted outer membrane repeat protein